MRPILPTVLSALALTSALGCAHTAPTATLAVAPAAKATAATPLKAAAIATVAATTTASTREVVLSPSATDAEMAAVDLTDVAAAIEGAPAAPSDEAAIPEAPAFDVSSIATRKFEAGTTNILDPWRPYGIGIVQKTHDTVTLAWRTHLSSRGMIYFGKSFGISWKGYNGVCYDNNKSKYHQVTVGGLSRFRSYTFTVVGLGELGMQFPTYAFKTRTPLF